MARKWHNQAREAKDKRREAHEIAHDHEANANQVPDEPMPASHHDGPRQEAAVRSGKHGPPEEGHR
jgi:hypothetical protein